MILTLLAVAVHQDLSLIPSEILTRTCQTVFDILSPGQYMPPDVGRGLDDVKEGRVRLLGDGRLYGLNVQLYTNDRNVSFQCVKETGELVSISIFGMSGADIGYTKQYSNELSREQLQERGIEALAKMVPAKFSVVPSPIDTRYGDNSGSFHYDLCFAGFSSWGLSSSVGASQYVVNMNSLSGRVVSIINQSRAFLSWDMRFVQNRSGRSQEQRKSIAFQAYASSNSSGSGRYLRHEQYWGLPDFTDRPNRLTPAHLQMASLKRPLLLDDYLFINEGKVDPERGYIVVTIDANTGEPLSLSFRPTNRRFRQIAGAMGSKREGENSSKQKSAQEPKSESIESPVKITGSLKLPGDSMSIRLGAFTLQESETSQSEWQKFWMVDDNQRFFTCELHPTHPELKMLVGKDKRLYMIPESIAVHIRKEIKSSAQWIRNSPRAK